MTFVDTNYFLRFLLKDNTDQYLTAQMLFTKAALEQLELKTSTLVFFEIAWVLKSSYGKDKDGLLEKLLEVLKLNVEFENHELLQQTLILYRNSNVSLVDCFNLVFSKQQELKKFKTFDKKLAKEFEKIVGKKL